MKKSRTILVALLVFLIFIFSGILLLPMFIVYGGFGFLDPFAIKERYSLDYYICLESYEPFENVTLLVPTAKLGSEELIPTNAVRINEIQYLLEREFERTRNPELIELYNSFGVLAEKVVQVL